MAVKSSVEIDLYRGSLLLFTDNAV